MAKAKEVEVHVDKLQQALEHLNKAYGIGTVLTLDGKIKGKYDVISSGSLGIDYITLGIGGWAKGKLYELIGWEGCLAEDTYIKFITVKPNGVVQDCKGSTIKHLYDRFHNRNHITEESEFNVTSINEEDRVFRNPILDVVKSGVKECFELITKDGFRIKTTKDHKFYTGTNYVSLSDLSKGDTVFIHNNTPYIKEKISHRNKYAETTMKFYYRGKPRMINGYPYFRETVHRLTFEATQNNMSYYNYKKMLNTVEYLPIDFWTIPEGYDVHHIDENTLNNNPSNLELLSNSVHDRLHALANHNNLRFMVTPDIIESITSVGEMETYDIKCEFPYNNFIAQGIVVHNSGKSTVCGHAIAECQKAGGVAMCIDGEHAIDKNYFTALGVDTSKLLISQPSSGEEGFQVAKEMIMSGKLDLLVIDSDSSLIPKSVLEGDMGDSSIGKKARLNNGAYPSLKSLLVQNKTCVIVVSQFREKIGVMFGNPATTQGGHALKFYSDCRLEISKSMAKDGDVNYGNVTKIKAIKNKMCPPYRVSQFDVVWGVGIDKVKEIVDLGVEFNIIQKAGSWFSYGETKIGQGIKGVADLLNDNPELTEEIRTKIIEKIMGADIPIEIEVEKNEV